MTALVNLVLIVIITVLLHLYVMPFLAAGIGAVASVLFSYMISTIFITVNVIYGNQ